MKIALFGTSHWHAEMHLDAALTANATVVAVWDEDAAQATEFAGKHRLHVAATMDDALALRPDLVVLMGHPARVPNQARRFIAAGVPMILEKPAAGTTEVIAGLARLARERGTFVGVPLPNRFGPVPLEHRRLTLAGRAGKLAHASFRLVNGPPQRYRFDGVGWLLDPEIGGGGALRNLGIHGIDAALSLAQGPLTILSASISNLLYGEAIEDYALIVMSDSNGAVFTVEAGYTYASMAPGGAFEWRLATANATLSDCGDTATCTTLDDARTRSLPPEPTATRYRLFMADTLQRLCDGHPPSTTLDNYLAAMTLIDAAYAEAEK